METRLQGHSIQGISPQQMPLLVIEGDPMMNTAQRLPHAQQKTNRGFTVRRQDVLRSSVFASEIPAQKLGGALCRANIFYTARSHILFISTDHFRRGASAPQFSTLQPHHA